MKTISLFLALCFCGCATQTYKHTEVVNGITNTTDYAASSLFSTTTIKGTQVDGPGGPQMHSVGYSTDVQALMDLLKTIAPLIAGAMAAQHPTNSVTH